MAPTNRNREIKKSWTGRPVAAFSLSAGLTVLSLLVIFNMGDGEGNQAAGAGYTVILRHYGVDAEEMERTAAIPLEDAIASLPGIKRIYSSSENSRTRVFAEFRRDKNIFRKSAGPGGALRDAVHRVYETLPSSAQRPEIRSSSNSLIPLWTAAVWKKGDAPSLYRGSSPEAPDETGGILLQEVKPALESLEGAGEVIVSGPGLKEVLITLRKDEAAARNVNPGKVAAALGSSDIIMAGGILREGSKEIPVFIDGRFEDAASLGDLYLQGGQGITQLKDLGEIRVQDQKSDILSRLDGRQVAVISVLAAAGADPGKLSRSIRKKLAELASLNLEFETLEDRGAEEEDAFRSVLGAAMTASALVALGTVFVINRGRVKQERSVPGRAVLACSLLAPFSALLSAALLVLLGMRMDRRLLSGLAVGIGAAVDPVILSAECLRGSCFSQEILKERLRKIRPPLISGAATTVAALLPLAGSGIAEEAAPIVCALGAVSLVSLLASIFILPPFLFSKPQPGNKKNFLICAPLWFEPFLYKYLRISAACFYRIKRVSRRFFARACRICAVMPAAPLSGAVLISLAGTAALILAGVDAGEVPSENSVYVHVEFEAGFPAEEGDVLLADWAQRLKLHESIVHVQTGAHTGSANALVSFDPAVIDAEKVITLIRSSRMPGAFIYIPESQAGERIWKITISGDENKICRSLAEEAAGLCAGLTSEILETALNFKGGGRCLELRPRREKLIAAGLSFSQAANEIRRGIYGPVAYKRTGTLREMDVRIRGTVGETPGIEELRNFSPAPMINTGSLMEEVMLEDSSGIYREDRRRTASFSVRTRPMDPRRAKALIMNALQPMEFPPGYGAVFDPDAVEKAEALSKTAVHFFLALVFCYIIIAGVNESFTLPLFILAVIPPSIGIPVLVMAGMGFPFNSAGACAFVAVSGMAVNAAIITVDGFLRRPGGRRKLTAYAIYRVNKSRISSLITTAGTTIIGALPFLFLREGSNILVRTLSLVTVFGVGTSCAASLLMIPSLIQITNNANGGLK